jgi:hypothetical protein
VYLPTQCAVLESDPLADIQVAVTNVRWVMKSGTVVVDKTHVSRAK